MAEKLSFDVQQRPWATHTEECGVLEGVVAPHGIHLTEAAEIYGNAQVAESYGYVARGYDKFRQNNW